MRDCSLFFFKSFQLKGILRKPITAPLMQNGELEALKSHQEESFTVDQSTQPAK